MCYFQIEGPELQRVDEECRQPVDGGGIPTAWQ